jgi:cytochrome c
MRLATVAALLSFGPTDQAIADGDPAAGAKVFARCAAAEPGVNRISPSLAGVIGRTAGFDIALEQSDVIAYIASLY